MFPFLKNHPFPVAAFFESSLVLTFAVPKEQLQALIPSCVTLDTFEDKWAFVAVAMVETTGLRPKGFPSFMGNDFFLIGYRIFVRYTNTEGKNLRGLYILKSETNKKKMEFLGNVFTHYNYTTTDIEQEKADGNYVVSSRKSNFEVEVELTDQEVGLPEGSPFLDWKTARRFAGPLPFTFTYLAEKQEVLIIQGMRQNWKPKPVKVLSQRFGWLDQAPFEGAVLANAFMIQDIPYQWQKGKKEVWKN